MSGLFSKKSKIIPEPPLPDILPVDTAKPMPNPGRSGMMTPPVENMQRNSGMNTHDMIPNDIEIGQSNMMPPPPIPDDISPGNLPSLDDQQFPTAPSEELFAQKIPTNVESRQLPSIPELPDVRDANISRKIPPMREAPAPMIGDEEIPAPPAIFSDEHFYDTPQEIRHLVKEEIHERDHDPDYVSKYNLNSNESPYNEAEEAEDHTEKEIIQVRTKGPLFVDIDSFRVMLTDIEHIKSNIKTTSEIMQHMTEIKNSKDREFERWRSLLEDMQRKINYVDKLLVKGA